MSEILLCAQDLSFSYNKNCVILSKCNLTVKEKNIYVLLGKNGSGKTTLLKCLNGIYQIDNGAIVSNIESVLINDSPKLYDYLTGMEYLHLVLNLNKKKNESLAEQLIAELELKEHLDQLINEYSLGTRHKLALITSLVLDYKLVLIDEPLTALDPQSSRIMIDYFKKIKKDITLIISTHMMHIAYDLADEILLLHNEKISQFPNNFSNFNGFEAFVLEELSKK